MSIAVLNSGLLTTIQDKGRYGYQKYGVIVSGAMDQCSMRIGNILVGNDENDGVLEITLIGPELKIEKGNLIAITGGNISPTINGKKVPMDRPVYLKEDCVLKFGKCISGCRAYLAIAGGIDVPMVMGSKSTYLRCGIGGKDGRQIKKGDVLDIGSKGGVSLNIIKKLKDLHKEGSFISEKWYVKNFNIVSNEIVNIRVFEDMQYNNIKEESIKEFFNTPFVIDSKSDRMGYRLSGPKIELSEKLEMISGEVAFGTIQIPPDGKPIILLADRATAGGYPKIAHVVAYDIPKLVQLKPSDKIIFNKISLQQAEKLYIKREEYIEKIKKSILIFLER